MNTISNYWRVLFLHNNRGVYSDRPKLNCRLFPIFILLAIVTLTVFGCAERPQLSGNEKSPANRAKEVRVTVSNKDHLPDTLSIADPTIFAYQGRYYLYGTSAGQSVNAGFKGFVSGDLYNWKRIEKASEKTLKNQGVQYLVLDSLHSFGLKGFWAPQVFSPQHFKMSRAGKKGFIMAYTANEQIAIAYSPSLSGPFSQMKPFKALFKDGFKHIDPFIFVDSVSGKTFLYYVKLDGGNKIFVSELEDSFDHDDLAITGVVPNTERLCIEATKSWENTQKTSWPVTEGPTVFYHNGFYYLLYSANDFRSPDYAVGYATAISPTGPWIKHRGSPIITGGLTGLYGTGHGDVFTSEQGAFYYVFHAHRSKNKVSPRKTYLISFSLVDGQGGEPDAIQMDYHSVRPLLVTHDNKYLR